MGRVSIKRRDTLLSELEKRYQVLRSVLQGADVSIKGHLDEYDPMVTTFSDDVWINRIDLSLAVGDFKTILQELSKVK